MWNALQATGHGHDTILIGELAPRGLSALGTRQRPAGLPGDSGQTKPLQFVRTLYCVNSYYRELRGQAAGAVGCPSTAAGRGASASRIRRCSTPAGSPITRTRTTSHPTTESSTDPDIAPFPRLPNLERALDRVQRMYGSSKRFPIYNDRVRVHHPPAEP